MRELKKVPGVLVPPRTDNQHLSNPLLNYHLKHLIARTLQVYDGIDDNAKETPFPFTLLVASSNSANETSSSTVAPLTLPVSVVEVWRC